MKTVFSNTQLAHAPAQEISDGELKPAVEIPSRAEIVLKTVRERNVGEIVAPEEFPVRPLHRVHAPEYVSFLESFWEKWTAAGRSREAFPFVWPIRSLRQDVQVEHIQIQHPEAKT